MRFIVRRMGSADRAVWLEMRCALWPDETRDTHATALDALIHQNDAWGFVAEVLGGTAVGFAEVAIRRYANGCDSRPVPFLEGIWVNVPFRRQRVGAQIIAYAESFLASKGFQEFGSDTEIENSSSQAAHLSVLGSYAFTSDDIKARHRNGRTGHSLRSAALARQNQ